MNTFSITFHGGIFDGHKEEMPLDQAYENGWPLVAKIGLANSKGVIVCTYRQTHIGPSSTTFDFDPDLKIEPGDRARIVKLTANFDVGERPGY